MPALRKEAGAAWSVFSRLLRAPWAGRRPPRAGGRTGAQGDAGVFGGQAGGATRDVRGVERAEAANRAALLDAELIQALVAVVRLAAVLQPCACSRPYASSACFASPKAAAAAHRLGEWGEPGRTSLPETSERGEGGLAVALWMQGSFEGGTCCGAGRWAAGSSGGAGGAGGAALLRRGGGEVGDGWTKTQLLVALGEVSGALAKMGQRGGHGLARRANSLLRTLLEEAGEWKARAAAGLAAHRAVDVAHAAAASGGGRGAWRRAGSWRTARRRWWSSWSRATPKRRTS